MTIEEIEQKMDELSEKIWGGGELTETEDEELYYALSDLRFQLAEEKREQLEVR